MTDNGETLFLIVCQKGHLDIVNALLNHKSIDINKARTDNGETPLLIALRNNYLKVVDTILNHESIDINKARTDNGETPLLIAKQLDYKKIVTYLQNKIMKENNITAGSAILCKVKKLETNI